MWSGSAYTSEAQLFGIKLNQDLSEHMDRIGPGVRELFNTYKFYYIKKYHVINTHDNTYIKLTM